MLERSQPPRAIPETVLEPQFQPCSKSWMGNQGWKWILSPFSAIICFSGKLLDGKEIKKIYNRHVGNFRVTDIPSPSPTEYACLDRNNCHLIVWGWDNLQYSLLPCTPQNQAHKNYTRNDLHMGRKLIIFLQLLSDFGSGHIEIGVGGLP